MAFLDSQRQAPTTRRGPVPGLGWPVFFACGSALPGVYSRGKFLPGGNNDELRSRHQERHRGRWHRRQALPGRCRDRGRQGRRDRQGDRGRQAHDRRRRAGRGAGLRRSAHPLRRADLLGRRGDALVMARRDQRGDGQLRRRHRALQARDARDRHARPGERRRHPVRRAEQGHHLGLGNLPASSWTPRPRASRRSTSPSSRR